MKKIFNMNKVMFSNVSLCSTKIPKHKHIQFIKQKSKKNRATIMKLEKVHVWDFFLIDDQFGD